MSSYYSMSLIIYEELPTPQSPEDLIKLREEVFNQRMEWINPQSSAENKWIKLKSSKEFVLEELNIDECDFPVLKGSGILMNVDITQLEHVVFDGSLKERRKITDDLLSQQVITTVNNDTLVIKDTFSAPIGFDNREFLVLKCKHHFDNGAVLVTMQSINCYKTVCAKKCIRGISNCAIYLEPIDATTVKIININHIIPKGNVSSMMVKLFKKRSLETLFLIQNVCQNK